MGLQRSATVVIAVLVLFVVSTLGLGVAATAAGLSHAPVGARASVALDSFFYKSKPLTSQPSPFCLVAGGTLLLVCYTPQDLKAAYNYPAGLTGAGQTIVIIDAFGYPEVQSDLNTFDAMFGLPATTIQIVCQGGVCPVFNPSNPDEISWSHEISLDTQYAHAMAPGAHIVLYVTTSDDDLVMAEGIYDAVLMFPGAIFSQSFGDPEPDLLSAPSSYVSAVLGYSDTAYEIAAEDGSTVFASAGDYGADNYVYGYNFANTAWPADNPLVTAVGGTMGNPYLFNTQPSCWGASCSTGLVKFLNSPACQLSGSLALITKCKPVAYGGEQVWNEPFIGAAGGGAPSVIYSLPSYQDGLGLTTRTVPDVSYNAAVDGGVLTYWSAGTPAGTYITGGTSAGSPQWAAITALINQYTSAEFGSPATIGFLNWALYGIGETPSLYRLAFHDITVGNNEAHGGYVGFNAEPGWDDATGWGTPNVGNLVPIVFGWVY